jgi:hypothetical protein
MESSVQIMRDLNIGSFEGGDAVDRFYTVGGFDARRYFARQGIAATPEHIAAYAMLKEHGSPITEANIDFIVGQISGN